MGLGGCASQSQPADHLFSNIRVIGPRDDLANAKNIETTTRDEYVFGNDETIANIGLSLAQICEKAKANCRSGVVSTELRYKVDKFDGHTVTVSGKILTLTSRNITTVYSRPPTRIIRRMSLVDGVDFIGEGREEHPFTGVLDLNDTLDIQGLYGTRITLWFDSKRY
jgi:hypothetical protein